MLDPSPFFFPSPNRALLLLRIQARQYLVTKLDLARHVAHTLPVKVNYYTAARNNVDVNVTKRLEVSEDHHAHT